AVIGRNGTGKTTLLRVIAGEESPEKGSVSIRRGASLSYLEQIPRLSGGVETTRDVLMQPFAQVLAAERRMRALEAEMAALTDPDALERVMRSYAHQQSQYEAMDGYATAERFGRIATGFGLEALLDRPFDVLSGGQKSIVMLARAMLRQPDILLLDEPTNHLDVRTLEWFEQTLARYKGTVVIVSHDRYFLDRVATRTVILERGGCRNYAGNYTFSQEAREKELLIEFAQFRTQQKKIEAMQAAIKRYRDWGARGDNEDFFRKAKELENRLEKMNMLERPQMEKQRIPLHFAGNRTSREVLRLRDFSLDIGGLRLLRDVSLTLLYRDRACLTGDNGTGKTTLLRAIQGDVPFGGECFLAPSVKHGYIPQEIRFSDDMQSVLEAFRAAVPCPVGMARSILAKYFFFGDNVFKRVSSLSGGEKVLLKLAILVQQEVGLLILDEPTNHIDIETREMLEEALLAYGGTILFISHDRYFIQKIATRILALEDGAIHSYDGDYDAYRKLSSPA
ncbi:ATP-binding cassette domain-containing protein, partial [Eubacteriales bacterium OttesenSCG-928-A19]|nr:ATP-binding cassette domain-containing protein [Eubacteriales bacterium OttesenSCG-928-A19]